VTQFLFFLLVRFPGSGLIETLTPFRSPRRGADDWAVHFFFPFLTLFAAVSFPLYRTDTVTRRRALFFSFSATFFPGHCHPSFSIEKSSFCVLCRSDGMLTVIFPFSQHFPGVVIASRVAHRLLLPTASDVVM